MTDDRPQCSATTLAGARCKQRNLLSATTGMCLFHDPDRRAEATAARQRGQAASSAPKLPPRPPRAPRTLGDLVSYLAWVIDATATGQLDKNTAAKITYSLNTLRGALTQRDLELQVKRLREELREARKPPARRPA